MCDDVCVRIYVYNILNDLRAIEITHITRRTSYLNAYKICVSAIYCNDIFFHIIKYYFTNNIGQA